MKQLLTLLFLITLISCEKDCEALKQDAYNNYINAIQNARTQDAVNEITRQYNEKISNLNC